MAQAADGEAQWRIARAHRRGRPAERGLRSLDLLDDRPEFLEHQLAPAPLVGVGGDWPSGWKCLLNSCFTRRNLRSSPSDARRLPRYSAFCRPRTDRISPRSWPISLRFFRSCACSPLISFEVANVARGVLRQQLAHFLRPRHRLDRLADAARALAPARSWRPPAPRLDEDPVAEATASSTMMSRELAARRRRRAAAGHRPAPCATGPTRAGPPARSSPAAAPAGPRDRRGQASNSRACVGAAIEAPRNGQRIVISARRKSSMGEPPSGIRSCQFRRERVYKSLPK